VARSVLVAIGVANLVTSCGVENPNRGEGTRVGRCDSKAEMPARGSESPVSVLVASELEVEVQDLTNAVRAEGTCCGELGCFAPARSLELHDGLMTAARDYAVDMATGQYLSHDGIDGSSTSDRIRAAGFDGCVLGENLSRGQPTARAAVESWLGSPSHCENLMWPGYRHIGAGHALDTEGRHYWVQTFGD
jgi:uncharacterized protein YkwD